MSRVFIDVSIGLYQMFSSLQSTLYMIVPILVLLVTSYMVLFSKDGLFNNVKTQERLIYFNQQTDALNKRSEVLQSRI